MSLEDCAFYGSAQPKESAAVHGKRMVETWKLWKAMRGGANPGEITVKG